MKYRSKMRDDHFSKKHSREMIDAGLEARVNKRVSVITIVQTLVDQDIVDSEAD